MKKLLLFILLILSIVVLMYFFTIFIQSTKATSETTTVTRGSVSAISSVSGKIDTKGAVKLSFPVTGTVREILKVEGDTVTTGEIIASLTQDSLVADYNAALENVRYQESLKNELLQGPRTEARTITKTNVTIAKENLARIEKEQAQLVQNAYKTLNSTSLEVIPTWKSNDDIPPTITGSYICEEQGNYILSIYRSNSPSGYSYEFSGLENGKGTGYTDTPSPFGNCGLSIQFDKNESYKNGEWTVSIPNTQSVAYIQNINTYTLALQQQKNAIDLAQQQLELAAQTEQYANARPTSESLTQINTRIASAKASLQSIEARIANYIIKAPFDGLVTDVDLRIGETVDASKYVSLVREEAYELKVRIPEVDIRNVKIGNTAIVVFDATPHEEIPATLYFISPLSTEIDGVAYYEGHLSLSQKPSWIREGLNADVDIILDEKNDVLIIPKRFTSQEKNVFFAYVKNGTQKIKTKIDVGLIGDDGYIEVKNLKEGTVLEVP